jgi:hypothetical protein
VTDITKQQTTPSLKIAQVISFVSLNDIEARLTCTDKTAPNKSITS